MTLQRVFAPHGSGHGSIHFLLTQALVIGQSELTIHSGRQIGGLPIYVGRQEQTAKPLLFRHSLYGPQGEGLQESLGVFCATGKLHTIIKNNFKIYKKN